MKSPKTDKNASKDDQHSSDILRLHDETAVARVGSSVPATANPRELANGGCKAQTRLARVVYLLSCGMCAASVTAAPTTDGFASPISARAFDDFAKLCAPSVQVPTLRAVASVESHFEPLALRDNDTHKALHPITLAAAIALADERIRNGHSIDLGVMQINSAHLTSLHMSLRDAFDPCRSIAAASRILLTGYSASSTDAERQAAILISLSRYNTGRPLAGIANGYADEVIAAQYSGQSKKVKPDKTALNAQWDVWGDYSVDPAFWLVTANPTSDTERAGAQTSDARNEGRAPATSSEKGEPYELSAYQESEPSKR